MDRKLVELGKAIVLNRPAGTFSLEDMQTAFQSEIAKLVTVDGEVSLYAWDKHKNEIFEIMATIINEVEPKKIRPLQMFMEVQSVPYATTKRFNIRKGFKNVKRFVTRVADAGIYERVRLDRDYFEMSTYSHGGAIYQTMDSFLRGVDSLSELLGLFMEALDEAMYEDVLVALAGIEANLPAANKTATSTWDKAEFLKILNTVSAYGTPTIFTSRAFAQAHLIPDATWVSDVAREEMRNKGYLGKFYGADVVILEQSFTDATNTVKILDETIAYILPSGGPDKPIKLVLEGGVQIREMRREDWSFEMQIYRRAGLAVLDANYMGIYNIA